MAISMLKIRRPLGRLIFNMGIATPGKTVFLIETAPCLPVHFMIILYEFILCCISLLRRVHHLLLTPSAEVMLHLNDRGWMFHVIFSSSLRRCNLDGCFTIVCQKVCDINILRGQGCCIWVSDCKQISCTVQKASLPYTFFSRHIVSTI